MNQSHGTGQFKPEDLARLGENVVFEPGVLIFHPENIEIGNNVYIGHNAILKGYHREKLSIADGSWIGQQVFIHSGGGVDIGENVGIGPGAKILTSRHRLDGEVTKPILHAPLDFAPVRIESGADIGVGAIILPGVTVGAFAQVAAGAVVTRNVLPKSVVAGVPAQLLRKR